MYVFMSIYGATIYTIFIINFYPAYPLIIIIQMCVFY